MANGHVGRPTNEEVAIRKRNKRLKILLPSGIIALAAVTIIGSGGLKGLMSATQEFCTYSCEDGWLAGENNTCYQESRMDAYILGDANNDSEVTLEDYSIIKEAKNSNRQITNIEQATFDLNQDGDFNELDLVDLPSSTDTSSTQNTNEEVKYVCPKNQAEGEINTTYELDEETKQCIVKTSKKANEVCVEEKKNELDNQEGQKSNDLENSSKEEQTNVNNNENPYCTFNRETKESICNYGDNDIEENSDIMSQVDTDEIDETDLEETPNANSNDNENFDSSENDEFTVIEKKSNYLDYAASNTKYGKITLNSVDEKTGTGILENIEYTIYNSDNCTGNVLWKVKPYENLYIPTYDIKMNAKNKKTNGIDIVVNEGISFTTVDFLELNNISGEKVVSIKQTNVNSNYNKNNTCKKVTMEANPTSIPKVEFKNKAKKYVKIVVDYNNNITGMGSNNQISYNNNKVKEFVGGVRGYMGISPNSGFVKGFKSSVTNKNYKFVGWTLTRNDGYKLCWSKDKKSKIWEKNCSVSAVVIGTKYSSQNYTSNLENSNIIKKSATHLVNIGEYLNQNNKIYTLKAQWKTTHLTVKLKNAKTKKAFVRGARVRLYKTYEACKKNSVNKSDILKVRTQDGTKSDKNTGILKLDNPNYNASLNTTYYARVAVSKFYKENNTCYAVSSLKKNLTLSFTPINETIEYYKPEQATGKKMTNTTKVADMPVKLSKNNYSITGKKFDHWTAYRTVDKKYRCNNTKSKVKGWFDKATCESKNYEYQYYKDGQEVKINTTSGKIIMFPHFKKQTSTKNTSTNNAKIPKSNGFFD